MYLCGEKIEKNDHKNAKGIIYKLPKLHVEIPLPYKGRGRGWGLDSAMPLARQEYPDNKKDTDPTPNPSPTREGKYCETITNK